RQIPVDRQTREQACGWDQCLTIRVTELSSADRSARQRPASRGTVQREVVAGVVDRALNVDGAAGARPGANAAGGVERPEQVERAVITRNRAGVSERIRRLQVCGAGVAGLKISVVRQAGRANVERAGAL